MEILVAGPSAPGAKEAVQQTAVRLGPTNTRKHVKWAKKLPEYAADFSQTDRTIKRWIRRGKETGELPPLDHPSRMAAWWRRNMDHEVPDYLMGFIEEKAQRPTLNAQRSTLDALVEAELDGTSRSPRDFSNIKGLDLEKNVEELRRSHAINVYLHSEALHSPEPNEQIIMLRLRNSERSFELLRKAEGSLLEFKKLSGGLVDPEPIRAELAQVFESLRIMSETMTDRILTELEKILPRKFSRVLRLVEKFLRPAIEKTRADEENIFRNLQTLKGPEDIQKLLAA